MTRCDRTQRRRPRPEHISVLGVRAPNHHDVDQGEQFAAGQIPVNGSEETDGGIDEALEDRAGSPASHRQPSCIWPLGTTHRRVNSIRSALHLIGGSEDKSARRYRRNMDGLSSIRTVRLSLSAHNASRTLMCSGPGRRLWVLSHPVMVPSALRMFLCAFPFGHVRPLDAVHAAVRGRA